MTSLGEYNDCNIVNRNSCSRSLVSRSTKVQQFHEKKYKARSSQSVAAYKTIILWRDVSD